MNILLVLIPISVLIAGFFVALFILSSRDGQYDDLETPAFRMLSDDKPIKKTIEKATAKPIQQSIFQAISQENETQYKKVDSGEKS